jgi:6-phosphofructokinase 1
MELLQTSPASEPQLIGIRENRITRAPLMRCVQDTRAVATAINNHDYARAMQLRGGSFAEAYHTFNTLSQIFPRPPAPGQPRLRLAVLNAGAPAPGMNTAVRGAVRLATDRGHAVFGVRRGFRGLIAGTGDYIQHMDWMSVTGWATEGGAELGTSRKIPNEAQLEAVARTLEQYQIQGLLVIGGWAGYQATHMLHSQRHHVPAFNIPIICLPATINNNLPGTELSIGADTALNNIVQAVDKIKQSAVASGRCFVVEVMGRHCGYLALLAGLASGAERVYLPEEGVTLAELQADVEVMNEGFRQGKRLSLMIRNENANPVYTTDFISRLFEEEGHDLFEVRQAILGHIQQGGDPSPFDRVQATRLAARCVTFLENQAGKPEPESACIGLQHGHVQFTNLAEFPRLIDADLTRPLDQWWLSLRPIAGMLAGRQ